MSLELVNGLEAGLSTRKSIVNEEMFEERKGVGATSSSSMPGDGARDSAGEATEGARRGGIAMDWGKEREGRGARFYTQSEALH